MLNNRIKVIDDQTLIDRQQQLIHFAWPDGVSVRDEIALNAVPLDERAALLNRLEAVVRAGRGEPLGPLAELAGLKRAAFFNLRRAWRTDSIRGLIPHGTKAGRAVSVPLHDPQRIRADELLKTDPGRRNVEIAKQLLHEWRQDNPLISDVHNVLLQLQKLERMVQHQRKTLATDYQFLLAAFGNGLTIDVTAVAMIFDDDEKSLAIAALVVDTGSGLILGSAVGHFESRVTLVSDAVLQALQFIETRKVRVVSSSLPDVGITLPPPCNLELIEKAVEPLARDVMVSPAGGYAFGQQLVQNFGPKVGRLVMAPRRTLAVDVDRFAKHRRAMFLSPDIARSTWCREVLRHNDPRMSALEAIGLLDSELGNADRLIAVLKAVRDAISGKGELDSLSI